MQHFVSEPYPQEPHYEAVDYNRKAYQACVNDLNKNFSTSKKSINKVRSIPLGSLHNFLFHPFYAFPFIFYQFYQNTAFFGACP